MSYDGNGNLTKDTFHNYAWDADGNPTTIDTYSFNYDAFDRRVEYGNGTNWSQYVYSPTNPGSILGTASGQTLALRVPMPGGGQAIVTSAGVNNYRRPNWQGSEVMASSPTQTVLGEGAFTPFGEHYNVDLSGYNGYFAGNLSISPVFVDGYAGTFRLYHYDQGRWISPDPAGLGAVDPTNPQSWNRYGYVMNNPLSGTDTSGLDPHQCPSGQTWIQNQDGDGGHCVPAGSLTTSTWIVITNCAQAALMYPGQVNCGSGYSGASSGPAAGGGNWQLPCLGAMWRPGLANSANGYAKALQQFAKQAGGERRTDGSARSDFEPRTSEGAAHHAKHWQDVDV